MEPPYNEPLYNAVLGITNDFLYPSGNKTDEKGTSIKRNLFVVNKLRFHCITTEGDSYHKSIFGRENK